MGELPCMGYIGMCGPKGYGFSAVLVINRVFELILAILVINRVWFLHSSLDLEEATFSSLSKRKSLHKLCLR